MTAHYKGDLSKFRPITASRMNKKAHYRSQLNPNQKIVAFDYNAMALYLGPGISTMRNRIVENIEGEILHHMSFLFSTDPGFHTFIAWWVSKMVGIEFQEEAKTMYRALGWNG